MASILYWLRNRSITRYFNFTSFQLRTENFAAVPLSSAVQLGPVWKIVWLVYCSKNRVAQSQKCSAYRKLSCAFSIVQCNFISKIRHFLFFKQGLGVVNRKVDKMLSTKLKILLSPLRQEMNWRKIPQPLLGTASVVKGLDIFKYGLTGSFSCRIEMPMNDFFFENREKTFTPGIVSRSSKPWIALFPAIW